MIDLKKQPFLYNFLTNSEFRIWRHIILIFSLVVISSNQVFRAYQDCLDFLGYKIYILCLCASISYLVLAYFSILVVAPKLLLTKRYVFFIATLSVLVAVLPLSLMLVQEYLVRSMFNLPYRLESYTDPLFIVNSLSVFTVMLICFFGTTISILLRSWIIESKHVSDLEKEHIQSEVDQLKDQITPDFLSNILNRTSVLVKTEPAKASDMLMRLGQLLRYQLYDCSREKVLLSSEVNFLTNYLDLEQLYSGRFDYKISITGDISRLFVSPLLFIPFVQYVVNEANNQNERISMHLHFMNENESIIFLCQLGNEYIAIEDDFGSIRQRLYLLYNDNYSLATTKGMIKLRLNLLNV